MILKLACSRPGCGSTLISLAASVLDLPEILSDGRERKNDQSKWHKKSHWMSPGRRLAAVPSGLLQENDPCFRRADRRPSSRPHGPASSQSQVFHRLRPTKCRGQGPASARRPSRSSVPLQHFNLPIHGKTSAKDRLLCRPQRPLPTIRFYLSFFY